MTFLHQIIDKKQLTKAGFNPSHGWRGIQSMVWGGQRGHEKHLRSMAAGNMSLLAHFLVDQRAEYGPTYKIPEPRPTAIYSLQLDPTSQWFHSLWKQGPAVYQVSKHISLRLACYNQTKKRCLGQGLPMPMLNFCYKILSWPFKLEAFLPAKFYPSYDQHKCS